MFLKIISVFLAILVNSAFLFQIQTCTSRQKPKAQHFVENSSEILKTDKAKSGIWGGKHIALMVGDKSTQIEFDCARGSIQQPFTLDDKGKFSLRGAFIAEKGGAVKPDGEYDESGNLTTSNSSYQDANKNDVSALYEGRVEDKSIKLTVTLIETKQIIGTFSLIYGKEPQLTKCY